jgi:hypothetical protein
MTMGSDEAAYVIKTPKASHESQTYNADVDHFLMQVETNRMLQKSQTYNADVAHFLTQVETTNNQLSLDELGISSLVTTAGATGTATPLTEEEEPLYILKPLGSSTYGRVILKWNVSTGESFAVKEPVKQKYKAASWREEANILNNISHISTLCTLW